MQGLASILRRSGSSPDRLVESKLSQAAQRALSWMFEFAFAALVSRVPWEASSAET